MRTKMLSVLFAGMGMGIAFGSLLSTIFRESHLLISVGLPVFLAGVLWWAAHLVGSETQSECDVEGNKVGPVEIKTGSDYSPYDPC